MKAKKNFKCVQSRSGNIGNIPDSKYNHNKDTTSLKYLQDRAWKLTTGDLLVSQLRRF